jgi:hypothetical protein
MAAAQEHEETEEEETGEVRIDSTRPLLPGRVPIYKVGILDARLVLDEQHVQPAGFLVEVESVTSQARTVDAPWLTAQPESSVPSPIAPLSQVRQMVAPLKLTRRDASVVLNFPNMALTPSL